MNQTMMRERVRFYDDREKVEDLLQDYILSGKLHLEDVPFNWRANILFYRDLWIKVIEAQTDDQLFVPIAETMMSDILTFAKSFNEFVQMEEMRSEFHKLKDELSGLIELFKEEFERFFFRHEELYKGFEKEVLPFVFKFEGYLLSVYGKVKSTN